MAWYQKKFVGGLSGPVRLFLIRHGQSEANTNCGFISGQSSHVQLTQLGVQQATALGSHFRSENITFDLVYSSSAERTKNTAKLAIGSDSFVSSDELLEIDMGDWVGRKRTEVYSEETLTKINQDPWNFKADNGESQKEVEGRK